MRKIAQIILVAICFSCQKSPESVVLKYFKVANEVVSGDTSEVDYLKNHWYCNILWGELPVRLKKQKRNSHFYQK